MTTPDSTPPAGPLAGLDLSRILPPAITFAPASPGALRCSACGALVDDDRAHVGTDDHTTFHKLLGEVVDALAVRVAQVEEAQADGDARIALDARAVRSLAPPAWGPTVDELVDRFLSDLPAGHVHLILDGPRDQTTPAADALERLLAMERAMPIMRDAAVPVQEQRGYRLDVNTLRNTVNRITAAMAATPRPAPARIPAPSVVHADDAAAIALHARAISLHLSALEGVAAGAGLAVAEADAVMSELGALVAEARHWVAGLDTWAESTAHRSGAPRGLLDGVEGWCQVAGGELPFGRINTAAPAPTSASAEADLGEPSEGSGVVRVRLEGDPDDVELAVELAEATGFPLNDVSDPYDNRRGPRGNVRRYGVVNLTRGRPVPRDQHAPDAMFDDQ